MTTDDEKSLEVLREILLSKNFERQEYIEDLLNDLKFKLNDKNSKIESFYPIITDLIERKIIESEEEVAEVLSPVISKSIKNQINYSRDEVIDALYPIMGQLIKKSVSESLKEFYNSLNQKIDNALKKGLFSTKIKSKISGVPTKDILLHNSLPFLIKEVFFIHESSGILISHNSSEDKTKSSDGDIISGMLTAIKEFVSESFKDEFGAENLYEIQYGNSRIVLERGRYSYLAVVVSGKEPKSFSRELTELSNFIHKEFNERLREFDGNIGKFKKAENRIVRFIKLFNQDYTNVAEERSRPVLLYFLLGLLGIIVLVTAYFMISNYFDNKYYDDIIYSKIDSHRELMDENFEWEVDDNTITLAGTIHSSRNRFLIDSIFKSIPQFDKIINKMDLMIPYIPKEDLIEEVRNSVEDLGYDDLKLEFNGDRLIIEGEIDSEKNKRLLGYEISNIPGVFIIINNLKVNGNKSKYDSKFISKLNDMKLYFSFNEAEISELHRSQLDSIVKICSELPQLKLKITGYSDNVGNEETKSKVALIRAQKTADYIVSQGISIDRLEIMKGENYKDLNLNPSLQRRVEFKLSSDL